MNIHAYLIDRFLTRNFEMTQYMNNHEYSWIRQLSSWLRNIISVGYLRARDQVVDHPIALYLGFTDCNILPTFYIFGRKPLDLSSIRTVCEINLRSAFLVYSATFSISNCRDIISLQAWRVSKIVTKSA